MGWVRITRRVLAAGGIVFILAMVAVMFWPRQPARAAEATVTGIYPEPRAERFLPTVVVVARSPDGRMGRMSIPANQIRCKVGDKIRSVERGVSIYLDQSSCASLGSYD